MNKQEFETKNPETVKVFVSTSQEIPNAVKIITPDGKEHEAPLVRVNPNEKYEMSGKSSEATIPNAVRVVAGANQEIPDTVEITTFDGKKHKVPLIKVS